MSVAPQKYQDFANVLEQLRSDISYSSLDAPILRQRTAIIQQFYLLQIIPLLEENTDSALASPILSIHTEISKQLRLLELDVMFLQSAKQATTITQRLDAVTNRLVTLVQYCQAIIQLYNQE